MIRLVISIAILCAGCEKPSQPEPLPAPSNDGVQILSLGRDTKRVLHYRLTKGRRTPLVLAMEYDLELAPRVQKMPAVAMVLDIVVEDVLPDGAARLRIVAKDVVIRDRPGASVDAATLAPMRDMLLGMTYTTTLTPDGTMSGGQVSGGSPGALRTQFDDMARTIEQVAMRFPRVPVGVGASWTSKKSMQVTGMTMTTVTTTTLTALDGDRVEFTSQTTLSAPDQKTTQQGITVELSDVGGGGSGKGTVDLATMGMRGELGSELRGTVRSAGTTTAMRLATTLKIE